MTIPNILDDPRLAKLFGRQPAVRPDVTGVGMPDPESIPLQAQLDSLGGAYGDARTALAAGMGQPNLSALDVLGMATGGDRDAKTMMRIANAEIPATRKKLAKAATRKAKFGKGGK